MKLRDQAKWWGVALIVLIAILYSLSNVLLPFLLGAAIAYFADPVADRLEARGISRVLSTVIITIAVILIAILAMMILVPLLINQVRLAIDSAPALIGTLRSFLQTEIIPRLDQNGVVADTVNSALANFQSQIKDISVRVLQGAWSVSMAGVQVVTLFVISPVVAFYLLVDWDRMIGRIDDLLPRDHAETIRELAREVDRVLAGFVRGQLSVCLVLGGFYALALILIQLPFGLMVGLFAGLISFIPFVGSILGGAVSIGIAFFYFWNTKEWIAITAVIFMVGQALEGNFLTPRLVGGSVGLHPVWLMFALSAFGALFGFAGLLIAVPAAAVIGVFLRFSIERYKDSSLYRSGSDQDA